LTLIIAYHQEKTQWTTNIITFVNILTELGT